MRIATVGHSTHSIDVFVRLLVTNEISAIADVRSAPYSRHNPQFNRESLKAALREARIAYAYLGDQLGARSDNPAHYEHGRVCYDRLAASGSFQAGVDRVIAGAAQHHIALMCAEKDPLTCHRTILVARALIDRGADVRHILGDGSIEEHDAALDRLMRTLHINPHDLFASPAVLRARAYAEQEARIAYTTVPAEDAAA